MGARRRSSVYTGYGLAMNEGSQGSNPRSGAAGGFTTLRSYRRPTPDRPAHPRAASGPGGKVGSEGEEHAERGAAAGAFAHRGLSPMEPGEPGNQREPDAHAGGMGGNVRALPEHLEHRFPEGLGDARTFVLHDQDHPVVTP